MYNMYMTIKRTPSNFDIRFQKQITTNSAVTKSIKGKLKSTMASVGSNDPANRDMPITARILKMLDPITLPIAISAFPLFAACILTTTSGSEVPNATIDRAIKSGLIPAIFDMPSIPTIVYFEPKKTKTPAARKTI